jgi:hypothetical protein
VYCCIGGAPNFEGKPYPKTLMFGSKNIARNVIPIVEAGTQLLV